MASPYVAMVYMYSFLKVRWHRYHYKNNGINLNCILLGIDIVTNFLNSLWNNIIIDKHACTQFKV